MSVLTFKSIRNNMTMNINTRKLYIIIFKVFIITEEKRKILTSSNGFDHSMII